MGLFQIDVIPEEKDSYTSEKTRSLDGRPNQGIITWRMWILGGSEPLMMGVNDRNVSENG